MKFKLLFLSVLLLGCLGLDMRSVCGQSPNPDLKDKCFSSLALRDANSTECKEVQNETMRDYCVMRIAISRLSEADCSDATSLREQCVHVVLGLRANSSLVCNLIQDNDTADLCRMR
ncbi:hypothetical protein H0N98_01320 [Candidatus Micrarchaeota archaeon]|jgi:hypothetical protein|nr:hypothetical protein [Candidatus Micrarchaeota archaeon]